MPMPDTVIRAYLMDIQPMEQASASRSIQVWDFHSVSGCRAIMAAPFLPRGTFTGLQASSGLESFMVPGYMAGPGSMEVRDSTPGLALSDRGLSAIIVDKPGHLIW